MLSNLIPIIAYIITKTISKTLRLKIIGADPIIKEKKAGRNYIFCFWHNQFFIMPYYYIKVLGRYRISILTSLSRDGEYISRFLHRFGFKTVRGSSSLGGESALRLLIRELENGSDVAITPDGPRGPRHKAQEGIITLASITGRPIIPVGYKADKKWVLNTWDRFIIPHPFTKGVFTISDPIYIPRDIDTMEKEKLRKTLEDILSSISS